MTDLATLGIAIDATQVLLGSSALDKFAVSGAAAEASVDSFGGAVGRATVPLATYQAAVDAGFSQHVLDRIKAVTDQTTLAASSTEIYAARAQALLGAVDPYIRAQQKANGFLAEADLLFKENALSATGFSTVVALVGNAFETTAGKISGTTQALTLETDALVKNAFTGISSAIGQLEKLKTTQDAVNAQTEFNTLLNIKSKNEISARTAASLADVKAFEELLATEEALNVGFAALIAEEEASTVATVELGVATEATGYKLKNAGRFTQEFGYAIKDILTANPQLLARELGAMAASQGLFNGLLSAGGLAVLGFAAVLGTVGFAMFKAEEAETKFNQAILKTGGYSGATASQVEEASKRIAASTGVSVSKITAQTTELIASGKYSIDTIDKMVESANVFAQAYGEDSKKVIKDFEDMKGGLVKWAVKHEETYHDLTLAQIDYINNLEKQGQHELAAQSLADDIQKRAAKNLAEMHTNYGIIETDLRAVATLATMLWDALLGFGKSETSQDKLNDVAKRIITLKGEIAADSKSWSLADKLNVPELQAQLKTVLESYRTGVKGIIAENKKATDDAKAASANDDAIREKYDNKDHKGSKPKVDNVGDNFQLSTDSINADAEATLKLAAAYSVSDTAVLQAEAHRKALTDATKKDVDQTLLDAREQANLSLAIANVVKTSDQNIANLNFQSQAQEKHNAAVASGLETEGEAQRQMAKEAVLRPLLAAVTLAHGDALKAATEALRAQNEAIDRSDMAKLAANTINATNATELQNDAIRDQIRLFNASAAEKETTLALDGEIAKLTQRGTSLFSEEGAAALKSATDAAKLKTELTNLGTSQTTIGQGYAAQIAADVLFQNGRVARYKAANNQIDALVKQGVLDFAAGERAKNVLNSELLTERLSYASQFFGHLTALSTLKNKELADIGKAAAIIQATIDTYNAINTTLAHTPYPWSIPLAAAVATEGFANVASIAGLKDGGLVTGDGGPRSDSILIAASNGEFMVNAEATARNRPLLEAINDNKTIPSGGHFASGGYISSSSNVSNDNSGSTHYHFEGADFTGTNPDEIKASIFSAIAQSRAGIVNEAVQKSYATNSKQQSRQKLNGKIGR